MQRKYDIIAHAGVPRKLAPNVEREKLRFVPAASFNCSREPIQMRSASFPPMRREAGFLLRFHFGQGGTGFRIKQDYSSKASGLEFRKRSQWAE
jgi:hypothetical protein